MKAKPGIKRRKGFSLQCHGATGLRSLAEGCSTALLKLWVQLHALCQGLLFLSVLSFIGVGWVFFVVVVVVFFRFWFCFLIQYFVPVLPLPLLDENTVLLNPALQQLSENWVSWAAIRLSWS